MRCRITLTGTWLRAYNALPAPPVARLPALETNRKGCLRVDILLCMCYSFRYEQSDLFSRSCAQEVESTVVGFSLAGTRSS